MRMKKKQRSNVRSRSHSHSVLVPEADIRLLKLVFTMSGSNVLNSAACSVSLP